jgi:hypothetical protein
MYYVFREAEILWQTIKKQYSINQYHSIFQSARRQFTNSPAFENTRSASIEVAII